MDLKRAINNYYKSVFATFGANYQLFDITPLISISNGTGQSQRINDNIKLESINVGFSITSPYFASKRYTSRQNATNTTTTYNLTDSNLSIETAAYSAASTGLSYEFVAPVPTDASGTGFQTPLSQVTTAVPQTLGLIRKAAGNTATSTSTSIFPYSSSSSAFNNNYLWQFELPFRICVIRTNYILNPTMYSGDTIFQSMSGKLSPFTGSNGGFIGNYVPVNAFIKVGLESDFEIIYDKRFIMGPKMFSGGSLSIDSLDFGSRKPIPIGFRPGSSTPQFSGYNPLSLSSSIPFQNNCYLVLMSDVIYGVTFNTSTPPTTSVTQPNFLLEINVETNYYDVN